MSVAALKGAARGVSQATGIAQDNIIFAMLLFAFVVWVTTKGELATYLAFFKPGAGTGPKADLVTATPSDGTKATAANPNIGTVVGAGVIPGVPGVNLNNPFAGIPGLGGGFQTLLPGNSNGGGAAAVPGQANPIPWGQVGTWLQGMFK